MTKLLHRSKLFLNRNASTILTIVGGVGVVATSVMAVKATPKAMQLLEEAREEKGEDLTKVEIVKTAGPVYIPATLVGVSTIACIFSANSLNKRQQAALMSAYALIDSSYKEYRSKLKELYGEETHNTIVDAMAVEKAQDVGISNGYFAESCSADEITDEGDVRLFYDLYSDRYFESTNEKVLAAEYHLNRNYTLRGYAVLNEFYEFLGLEPTDFGDQVGWAPLDEGMYWIEFNHRHTAISDDGLECVIIEMPFEPTVDYMEY